MAAPGLSRVRILACLGSLIVHAAALGAFFWVARAKPIGFGAPAPTIMLVSIEQPRAPAPWPRAPRSEPGTHLAASAEAAPPATVATITPDAASDQSPIAQSLAKAEEDAYVRAVWLQLAAHRPRSSAGRRTARIAFGLTPGGELRYVRLETSSGSAAFDSACLSAIRAAAPFPPAPAEASERLLDFVAPISTQS